MTLVIDRQETTIQKFHKRLVPQREPERNWLYQQEDADFRPWSHKEIIAQANCTAAYLMMKGIRNGSHVMVIASQSPFYLIVDLALQYLGAVNITLPEEIEFSELKRVFHLVNPEYILIENDKTYLNLNELRNLEGRVTEVGLHTVNTDNLSSAKLVTFEIIVNLGKIAWRENASQYQEIRSGTTPEDTYSLIYKEGQKDLKKITFGEFIRQTEIAAEFLVSGSHTAILGLQAPYNLQQRTYGYFAPMLLRIPVFNAFHERLDPRIMRKVRPTAMIVSPAIMDKVYKMLPGQFLNNEDKNLKAIEKAHKICEKRNQSLEMGKKPPLMVRIRYASLRRGLFSKVNSKFGGKLNTLIYEPGKMEGLSEPFFRYVGFEIFHG